MPLRNLTSVTKFTHSWQRTVTLTNPISLIDAPTSATPAEAAVAPGFDWLAGHGVVWRDDDLADFGDRRAEGAAALQTDVVSPLVDLGVINAQGADTDAFLQGQLSNDLRELTPGRAQLSSYSNPKGRVLALFTLIRRPEGVWLETQRGLLDATCKRLRMFVLRAKVKLADAGAEVIALGLAGPNSASMLTQASLPVPTIVWGCAEADGVVVVRRPGRPARYTVHGSSARIEALWPCLAASARPVGTMAWRLLDMLAGLPAIHPETREQHVAQMLNLDRLDGISFVKGCYPGQEIVARLHYLGNLKRRLFLGYTTVSEIARGTAIYSMDNGQPVGEVLDSALHPHHALALHAVLQVNHGPGPLRLGAIDGPELILTN